jgi:hypothetical protein
MACLIRLPSTKVLGYFRGGDGLPGHFDSPNQPSRRVRCPEPAKVIKARGKAFGLGRLMPLAQRFVD